jgi:hypothetical protein
MMAETQADSGPTPIEPTGHVIGFIETQAACDGVVSAFLQAGIAPGKILVLHGHDGSRRLHEMMDGSQWGEEVQRVLKEGEQELVDGHFVICIESTERPEALRIAMLGKAQGGHGFSHFRTLVDERFTR